MSILHHFHPFGIEYRPERLSAFRSSEVVQYEVRRDLVSLGVPIATAQLDITRSEEKNNTVIVASLIATEAVRRLITDLACCKTVTGKEKLEKLKIMRINLAVNKTSILSLESPFTPRQSDDGKSKTKLFEPDKKVTSYRLNKKGKSKASSSYHAANDSLSEDNTEPDGTLACAMQDDEPAPAAMDYSQREPVTRSNENAEEKIIRLETELQNEKNAKQKLEWKTRNDQIIIDGLNAKILRLEERLKYMQSLCW